MISRIFIFMFICYCTIYFNKITVHPNTYFDQLPIYMFISILKYQFCLYNILYHTQNMNSTL